MGVHKALNLEGNNEKEDEIMARPHWYIRKTESGNIIEESIFLKIPPSIVKTKSKPKSKEKKNSENENRRIRDLGRLINANYTSNDFTLVLTYDDKSYAMLMLNRTECESEFESIRTSAEHELKKYIMRCQYECHKLGIIMRAIYVTSDKDSDTGNHVRVHHHVIVNNDAVEIMIRQWHDGLVKCKSLNSDVDHTGLAAYIIRQSTTNNRRAHTYGRTRNLLKPTVSEYVLANPDDDLIAPEGAQIISSSRNKIKYLCKPIKQEDVL